MQSSIKSIRNHVAALRTTLLRPSPEELQRCLPLLTDAAGCLSRIGRDLESRSNRLHQEGDLELGRELKALQRDLRAAGKLIEHGAAFWDLWAKLFGAATGGYMPSGEPRPVAAAGTISVQG
jgi:hypothetical protein